MNDKISYFAGLFEGEGSAFIQHAAGKYVNIMDVGMYDKPPLLFLRNNFGGCLSKSTNSYGRVLHKWRLTGKKASELAEQVMPYIRATKKRKALECVIAFAETIGYPGKYVPEPVKSLRAEIYARCHEINCEL